MRAGADAAGNDVIVLMGPEPDYQWGAFCGHVCKLAGEFGVRLVCGLGAFPAPVPHTRPVRVVATSTDADLAARVGFIPGGIEVPAGIEAVLEREFLAFGTPAVGLWARVPHYLSAMPYPEAGAALLGTLGDVSGLRLDSSQLVADAADARVRIDQLIANSADHRQMVAQLEHQVDAAEEPEQAGLNLSADDLPSGDELAAELQRFLRGEL
jgi:predicted ATP-grasp superfamily ATP-dependent carboligase